MKKYIYSTFDAGAVATFDGGVYEKVGETYTKPDRSYHTTDLVDIKGLTYNKDDNNSERNAVHKEYTAIEMAISNLAQFTTRVWKNPTIAANSLITPMSLGEQILDYDITWTAPVDGVARIIVYNSADFDITFYIRINGVDISYELKQGATQKDAYAIKVLAGDVIEIPGRYARICLLPYEYHPEYEEDDSNG